MLDLSQRSTDFERGSRQVARLPAALRLIGKAMALYYRLVGKHRYDDFRVERVHGLPFLVTPSVFNPKVPRTGEFLAAQLNARTVRSDWHVLDMGTGSGVCAIIAAKHARRVIAVDINEAAVRCTGINAHLNRLEHRVEVRQGDLFAPVLKDRFDLVLFNPPFVKGSPSDDRDRAWRSNDVAERFAAHLGAHLNPGGSALVVLSTFGDGELFLQAFRNQNFDISVVAERRFINERLTIFKLAPRNLGSDTPAASDRALQFAACNAPAERPS